MVSIIMPAFNAEKYIESSIRSVLGQTYEDWELIILNDGSTDRTKDIIDRMESEDENGRIHLIFSDTNLGASQARNTGVFYASGKYILFLDSNNILSPDALEVLVKKAEETDADLTIGNYLYTTHSKSEYKKGSRLKEDVYEEGRIIECMHFSCVCGTKLIRSDIICENNVRFPKLNRGGDLVFYHILLSNCKRVVTVDEYTLTSREPARANDSTMLDFIEAFYLIRKNYQKKVRPDFEKEVLYDQLLYYTEIIKRLPRCKRKVEREIIFRDLTEDMDRQLEKEKETEKKEETTELEKKYARIKSRKPRYVGRIPCWLKRVLYALKHLVE